MKPVDSLTLHEHWDEVSDRVTIKLLVAVRHHFVDSLWWDTREALTKSFSDIGDGLNLLWLSHGNIEHPAKSLWQ